MNQFLKRFLQGLLLGFALITAIGGGTMAVLIGVYDDLINAVSDFRKNPKKSLDLLIPMALGGIVSMGALFYPIKLLLEHFPFITVAFFAGLTLGGLRVFQSTIKGNVNWKNLLLTLAGFLFVFGLGAFSWFSTLHADLVNINFLQIVLLFFVAFISMGGHVSAGISGTFILVAFGYYEELIDFLIRLVKFNFVHVGFDLAGLFSFVIGSFLGLVVIAKTYKYFFAKNRVKTNFAIFGFIVGSIVIAFFNGKIRPEYAKVEGFNTLMFVLCFAAVLLGAILSYTLLGLANKKEKPVLVEEAAENSNNKDE
ncbi:MAG: hypothetical protein BWY30_00749 [Tenericutes bacterium ADurb.Bin239]|nr:MAG: hypothetical protein BWY30_00749 [Tenericutes bacterium ADurb.Bin239]